MSRWFRRKRLMERRRDGTGEGCAGPGTGSARRKARGDRILACPNRSKEANDSFSKMGHANSWGAGFSGDRCHQGRARRPAGFIVAYLSSRNSDLSMALWADRHPLEFQRFQVGPPRPIRTLPHPAVQRQRRKLPSVVSHKYIDL